MIQLLKNLKESILAVIVIILLFTDNDDEILNDYTLVESGDTNQQNYDKYTEEYPKLSSENLYVINKINKEEQSNLNNLMANPIMVYYTLTSSDYADMMKEQMLSNVPEQQKVMLSQMSMIDIVKNMNDKQREELLD